MNALSITRIGFFATMFMAGLSFGRSFTLLIVFLLLGGFLYYRLDKLEQGALVFRVSMLIQSLKKDEDEK